MTHPGSLFTSLVFCISWFICANTHAEQMNSHRSNIAWERAPLVLSDLHGKKQALKNWQGSVILLNFWATWCRPCQTEIPDLIDYQAQYAGQGLQVIGVGIDDRQRLRDFAAKTGINYPILHAAPDDHYPLLKMWGNSFGTLPYTVVIDRDGRYVYMQLGLFQRATFDTYVKPLLAGGTVH